MNRSGPEDYRSNRRIGAALPSAATKNDVLTFWPCTRVHCASLVAHQRASQRFEDILGDAPKNASISGRSRLKKAVLTRRAVIL
jgi:hypothetical protein